MLKCYELLLLFPPRIESIPPRYRSDLTVVCKGMNFALYPFDSHTCYLKLTSCKYKRGSSKEHNTQPEKSISPQKREATDALNEKGVVQLLTEKAPVNTKLTQIAHFSTVGHDNTEMILRGGFTYHQVNQRALYFNVAVREMDGSSTVFVGKNSNYSMYALEFSLSRIVTQYLLNVYLPTGIFVIISWVSFIIPVEIIAARVVLLITLTLVLINMFNKVT